MGATVSESAVGDIFLEIGLEACRKLNCIEEKGRSQQAKICFHN